MDLPSQRPSSDLSTSSTPSCSTAKRTKNQADAVLTKISKKLDEPKQPPPRPEKYASFGQHVAERLRSFSPNMANHCEKIISDALYYAELRHLNYTSRIVTDPVQISIVPSPNPQLDTQHSESILTDFTQL